MSLLSSLGDEVFVGLLLVEEVLAVEAGLDRSSPLTGAVEG